MARIRSIHPSFFTDEGVLSCSMAARMLYVGLWTEADCQGVFEWRPVQLKVRLLPVDAVQVADLLAELVAADLIREFSEGGNRYGAIRGFRHFQRPKKPYCAHPLPAQFRQYVALDTSSTELGEDETPPVPDRAPPQLALVVDQSPTSTPPVPHQRGNSSAVEGREGKEEEVGEVQEGGSPRKRGSRLPSDWSLTPALVEYGVGLGFTEARVASIAERFRLHWQASSGRNATKLDWDKAFQGWLRDDADKLAAKPSPRRLEVW